MKNVKVLRPRMSSTHPNRDALSRAECDVILETPWAARSLKDCFEEMSQIIDKIAPGDIFEVKTHGIRHAYELTPNGFKAIYLY